MLFVRVIKIAFGAQLTDLPHNDDDDVATTYGHVVVVAVAAAAAADVAVAVAVAVDINVECYSLSTHLTYNLITHTHFINSFLACERITTALSPPPAPRSTPDALRPPIVPPPPAASCRSLRLA